MLEDVLHYLNEDLNDVGAMVIVTVGGIIFCAVQGAWQLLKRRRNH